MTEAMPHRVEFTKEMKKTHTILVPNMAPIHFAMLEQVLHSYGYRLEVLKNEGHQVVDEGLRYVHNDTCYPALLVIGQMMDALHSGRYDVDHTALLITQTCGGCRASNYLHLLRKALAKAGMPQIPIISMNVNGIEKNSGFKITLPLLRKAMAVLAYGDLLMLLANQTRPYETNPGETDETVARWVELFIGLFARGKGYTRAQMKKNFERVVESFAQIPIQKTPRVKVGVVGEIYVKYASLGNNGLETFLAQQGCEVMLPGLLDFIIYTMDAPVEDVELYGGSAVKKFLYTQVENYLCRLKDDMIQAVAASGQFMAPSSFAHLRQQASTVIGLGSKMGEGWLLTGEMLELCELGYNNIVCVQPFGCLPNHIVGKGMIRRVKEVYPAANIVPVDYDPGATQVNQENRIKLMLAVAAEALAPAQEMDFDADEAPALAPV